MTGATHLLAGAAVSKFTRWNSGRTSAIVGIVLAFCSHFLLDRIPHFELAMPWQLALAVLATVFLVLIARRLHDVYILLGGAAGLLPDIIVNLGVWPAFTRMHDFFHFHLPYPVPSGLIYMEFCFDILLIILLTMGA